MQQDLTRIPSGELVDMLIRDTGYYSMLTRENADLSRRRLVERHIDLIVAEMKTREGYSEVFDDDHTGTIARD